MFKLELILKMHHHDASSLEEGKFALWSLAWGQKSDIIRTKIKSAADFLNQDQDKRMFMVAQSNKKYSKQD